jgi:hypothetical protein
MTPGLEEPQGVLQREPSREQIAVVQVQFLIARLDPVFDEAFFIYLTNDPAFCYTYKCANT